MIKHITRTWAALLSFALLLSLTACGKKQAAQEADQSLITLAVQSGMEANMVDYTSVFSRHDPMGEGIGVHPGRVVWDYDPGSVSWDDDSPWWETSHFNETVILRMVRESITALAGTEDIWSAWDAIFSYHNEGNGYQKGQKIAIKCNMNGSDGSVYAASSCSYTNPVLLKALLTSLVEDAGVAPSDITAYDVSRLFPQDMIDLCSEGNLTGVNFVGHPEGKRSSVIIEWSYDFNSGANYLPTCVTEASYLINLANLKGHSYGITLCGKNHFGSFLNNSYPYVPMGANLHQWLTSGKVDEYSPLVDFMASKYLGQKTVLYMLDAIICARSEGSSMKPSNTKWESTPFNGGYTSSIFVSQDPVAIDSVGADFLEAEPTIGADRDDENYLHEAGGIAKAPSGTVYQDGVGVTVTNVGVHEHWNDPVHKQYSRNLGQNEGIELLQLNVGADSAFSDVPADADCAKAVAWCQENGLMSGVGNNRFHPEGTLTRAMMSTVLYRANGSPSVSGAPSFTDTQAGAWYSDAVVWSATNGILQGYGNSLFGTNDPVSREQLATILWRYDGTPAATINSFPDSANISSYALSAVNWAVSRGILLLRPDGGVNPLDAATRAEVATALYAYLAEGPDAPNATPTDSSEKPVVYMTTDISTDSLMTVYQALNATPTGNVAVKLSIGEPNSNYLRADLIGKLVQSLDAAIVECNTIYGGSRGSTAMHLQVAKDHGYTAIAEVDILDADGSTTLSVSSGSNLTENYVGSHFGNYDYYVVLSHFKGHSMAGFGGAIKNISIGLGSQDGKRHIHSAGGSIGVWNGGDPFLESMAEAGKSVVDALDGNILYINVMNRLSVGCDCENNPAEPDMHDIGILASFDPVALDQACVDLVYAAEDGGSLQRRIESRNGVHTLEHAEEIGLGKREYQLVNIDG